MEGDVPKDKQSLEIHIELTKSRAWWKKKRFILGDTNYVVGWRFSHSCTLP